MTTATVLIPFEDEEAAIALANDTRYGWAAAVWTRGGEWFGDGGAR
jgi:acyl-CoA reductase-like NAD-dependent aldehyde dehydrogenase